MKAQRTLIATILLAAFGAAQAQTVSVIQPHTDVGIGDSFSVAVQGSGFVNKIFGGGYNIAFDPSILQLESIVIPASWEFTRSTGLLDAASGTVSDVYFNTFAAPVAGDFLTATLNFKTIGAGTSAITLSESVSFPFGDEFGEAVAVNYVGGTVAAVPEPGAIGLVLAGLACVGWAAARRRQA